jgi:hypothetical protein
VEFEGKDGALEYLDFGQVGTRNLKEKRVR